MESTLEKSKQLSSETTILCCLLLEERVEFLYLYLLYLSGSLIKGL